MSTVPQHRADAFGIHTIDTGFHRPAFDACYLIRHGDRGAFVDCGINSSLPRLLQAIDRAGLRPEAIDWLILTHVHLDHAGGAGQLMQHLPNARLVVHPRGAPHMVDPARLQAGAEAVYGVEEVARTYGRLVPVPAERVVEAGDGHTVDLAGRALVCLDAPGHARHHLVLWDAHSRSIFSGDTFGLSYRELDSAAGEPFALPTTTPVQFEPEPLKASIRRMLALQPARILLTHYGEVQSVDRLGLQLLRQVDAMVALARGCADAEHRHAALCDGLRALYVREAQAAGSALPAESIAALLAMDIELNAQGLAVWLDRDARGR